MISPKKSRFRSQIQNSNVDNMPWRVDEFTGFLCSDDLFAFHSLQYDKLGRLIKDFEPFKNMWLTASDWQKWYDSWMNDPLTTIDAEQLEQNVNNAFKTIFKCAKHFKEIPACQEVAMEVKQKIENFKPYIPLIQGLRNPGMRSRHWEQVRVFFFQLLLA